MSPSLASLRVFDAAARRLSFKAAAEELHVSAAAVSQRIRQLENHLGARLFQRLTRQVVLTEEGQLLASRVRVGLAVLDDAVAAVSKRRQARPLLLSTTTTFAEQCLLPVLGSFSAEYREVEVRVDVSNELVDLETEGIDLAIRQGHGAYPMLDVKMLFSGQYVPTCSRTVAKRLAQTRLIHVDWPARITAAPTWNQWLRRYDPDLLQTHGGIHVATEAMAIRAAIAGQGVALVHLRHLTRELETGELVRPFGEDAILSRSLNYYLVRSRRQRHPSAHALWLWLLAQFSETRPAT